MSHQIQYLSDVSSPAAGTLQNKQVELRPEAELVRRALIDQRLETPFNANDLNSDDKCKIIRLHFTEIMNLLGLDLKDGSLTDTPRRIAKLYVNETFSGLAFA